MINLSIQSEDLEEIGLGLIDLEYRVFDLMPLASQVAAIMTEDNMEARLAGEDKDGVPFAPLSPATWEINPDRGAGPPLAPEGTASRIISGFTIDIFDVGPGAVNVRATWPDMPFLHYHVDGYVSRWGNPVPARNPVGIRPQGWAQVGAAFDAWVENLLNSR